MKIQTKSGIVDGNDTNGIHEWFGIPYAEPLTQATTFKRSVPIQPWEGIKQTKAFADRPYQFLSIPAYLPFGSKTPMSLDCLSLNIWSRDVQTKKPVFVWIYGGANMAGEGSDPMYNGTAFANEDIVFVNFNYRLGPYGFYDFSIYDDAFDSNNAVSDMINALKWIKANIEAFGGDPDNITIAGESAGGTAVYTLLATPTATPLFNKAIAMSGLAVNISDGLSNRLQTELLLNELHIKPAEITSLKSLTPQQLQKAVAAVVPKGEKQHPAIMINGPVVDDLVSDVPWRAIKHGSAQNIQLLAGTTKDESTLFTLLKMFPTQWRQIHEACRQSQFPDDWFSRAKAYYNTNFGKQGLHQFLTDRAFWLGHQRVVNAQAAYNTVYQYRYDYTVPLAKLARLEATHGFDIGTGLNTQGLNTIEKLGAFKRDNIIADYHGAFISFAKTGVPRSNHSDFTWPCYNNHQQTVIINSPSKIQTIASAKDRLALWSEISDFYAIAQ